MITKVGYKLLEVLFQDGARTYGKRLPESLHLRDKSLKGADKPTDGLDRPLRKKTRGDATEADSVAISTRGGGLGREGRVLRNVQLGREEV